MTFYLNLAMDNINNKPLARAYLKRALSMANKECRQSRGLIMKALNHVGRN